MLRTTAAATEGMIYTVEGTNVFFPFNLLKLLLERNLSADIYLDDMK